MGAKSILLIAGIAMATLIYLVYLGATYEPPQGTTTIVIPAPEPQPLRPAPEPSRPRGPATPQQAPVEQPVVEEVEVVQPEEAITEPEPADSTETEAVQLPSLNASDSFIAERLQQLNNGAAIIRYLADEQLVRRFVVLVDNVSQGNLPQTNLPYRNVTGEFPVRTIDDNLFELDAAGYRRFDQVVNALVAMDTNQAVTLYRLAAPLFQQAYAELGYGDREFDDTLRRAIRMVLDTDEVGGSLQLVKPSVMYLYADSQIEGLSDIQKQMIRIGPENREKVKAKLRQLLLEL